MKKMFTLFLLSSELLLISGCANNNSVLSLKNPSFESGDLSNWEIIDSNNGINDNNVALASSDKNKRHIVGNFYFDSSTNGESATGSIKSNNFKMNKSGRLAFLLGAGKNKDKVYISVYDAKSNNELVRYSNKLFNSENPNDRLYRQEIDLKSYLNKELYILIVDNDSNDDGYNHILVDDFILDYDGELDSGTLLEDANKYIKNFSNTIDKKYRHKYHLMPEIGWMNDPNGLVYYNGEYHLFYQYNPYSPYWDTMYWGHATSKDLIKWEYQPVALAPDKSYDINGCFSGGAIVKDNNLNLLYTSVDKNNYQTQSLATSLDEGVNFSKRSLNPVIDSTMRGDSRITDFRDPFLFFKDNYYYALVGGKLDGMGGELLLYKSLDLLHWSTVGKVYSSTLTNTGMFECPNYINVDGVDVLLSSPQSIRDKDYASYQNIHSVTYQLGNLDFNNGQFTNNNGVDYMEELDKGFDFYATQVSTYNENPFLLAWMNLWSRKYVTSIDGWTGEVTLPRTISIKDNHLYQSPISSIEKYYTNITRINDISVNNEEYNLDFQGNCLSIKAELDVNSLGGGKGGFKLLKGNDEETLVYYDDTLKAVVFNRVNSGIDIESADDDGEKNVRYAKVEPIDGKIKLEIFIDVSSVEVFINDGYYTMSGLVYPKEDSINYSIYSDGQMKLISLEKRDIEVD